MKYSRGGSRALHVFVASAVATAAFGLVARYRDVPRPRSHRAWQVAERTSAPLVPTYAGERERHHDNRLRHPLNLRTMASSPPVAESEAVAQSDSQREAALEARGRLRAYDGAPPVIPHAIAQRDYPNCLSCHGDGMVIGTRSAPPICHRSMASCTQCHAPATPGVPPATGLAPVPVANEFHGLESARAGERAWPGAPPTIPHSTLMRSRCESCHGVFAAGLRTSHPWRDSCEQCHAPSAALDQRPAVASAVPARGTNP